MANINHLDMAQQLLSLSNIEVKKSFFGLLTTVYYTPTHSVITVKRNEYDGRNGDILENILKADAHEIPALLANAHIEKASMGFTRVDACISKDQNFVAVQLLHYVDFDYVPVTGMLTFEGDAAKAIASLF